MGACASRSSISPQFETVVAEEVYRHIDRLNDLTGTCTGALEEENGGHGGMNSGFDSVLDCNACLPTDLYSSCSLDYN
jgi:hypothetical protein